MKDQKGEKPRRLVVKRKPQPADGPKETLLRPEVRILDDRLLMPRHLVAASFGVHPDAVGKWAVKAVIKRGNEALYYLPEVIEYRGGSDGTPKLNPAQEKALLDRIRRETAELELKRKRGLYVNLEDASKEWAKILVNLRQRLLAMPNKLARVLVPLDKPQEIQELLYREISASMEELNDEWASRINSIEDSRGDVQSAAEAEPSPVG